MFKRTNLYNNLFFGFLISIFIIYFYFRPQNSEWFRIITADGLGYYSYLPAKFIYHDDNLDFKWFDTLYNKYYRYNSFAVPVENFTADFHGKQINKYYPGLSFLWMPFFLGVHALCKIFGLHADGMSQPYQMAMGFAAIVYTCLGLWYLRKFLLKLFQNELVALSVPVMVFYGTNLFTFAIHTGTFSHAYSFTFIIMALYYTWCFFNENEHKFRHLLLFSFCTLIIVFIRPINIIYLLAVPAFMQKIDLKELIKQIKFSPSAILIIVAILTFLAYSFQILYTQTGQFFPNTFYNEKFHFERGAHIYDVLLSYHAGWFLYVPLGLICFFSLLFIKRGKQNLFLILVLLLVIYLYSNWWFYNIFWRTVVDYTGVVALLLAFLLFHLVAKPKWFKLTFAIMILSVFHFQLKAYQLRNAILDGNYTYSDYYWRHFFTVKPINIFPVHPKTVLEKVEYNYDYNTVNDSTIFSENKYEGTGALKLYSKNYFSDRHDYKMPDFTGQPGFVKIKTSFYVYFTGRVETLQLVYTFHNKGKELFYFPFRISKAQIRYNKWDYKEIGCDVPREITAADSVGIFFWDEWGVNKVYIDKVKHEFFLTDSSMEMVP